MEQISLWCLEDKGLTISFSNGDRLVLKCIAPFHMEDGKYSIKVNDPSWYRFWSCKKHTEMDFCAIKNDEGLQFLQLACVAKPG